MNTLEPRDLYKNISDNTIELQHRVEAACERCNRSAAEIKIVSVTKNFFSETIRVAYECGLRDFGENRVQEAENKYRELSEIKSITWHMVGHLQSNKVKDALEIFDVIHSVDSIKLAQHINEHARKTIPVFIEVNVGGEATKYGFGVDQVQDVVKSIAGLGNLQILGLMTVAPPADNPEDARPVFRKLRQLNSAFGFKELSMGMTDDFEVAIEEGATMIRIGRAIFGERR
ncbi:MAG: YggS family pyridoxal phosphate-dependent enzyme [Chloroflexi bacterium]|nr:YggS family pyridoxal phosphate-dependent enzyme [Chloroflexota bacterium]